MTIPQNLFGVEYKPAISEIRYETGHDAAMRLMNSIIRYLDVPVYVIDVLHADVPKDIRIMITTLDSAQNCWVSPSDDRLDISSPPLGWINSTDHGPFFIERAPTREQKQGWDPQRSYFLAPFMDDGPESFRRISFHLTKGPITGRAVHDMMTGSYPIIAAASNVSTFPLGAAISFDYCLARPSKKAGMLLLHRQFPVGYYRPENRTFIFTNDSLTKTRRRQIEEVISDNGGGYIFHEY